MKNNINMNKAKELKNDEFYTLYEDIEKELNHYKQELKGKIIYCNCDDPSFSNFYKFFINNFHNFKLKEIVFTSISNKNGYRYVVENGKLKEIIFPLENGSFSSEQCIEILKGVDVVVSNPPFSLFNEYTNLLMKHQKDFLIIGNYISINLKSFFVFLKNNLVRLGVSKRGMNFVLPDGSLKNVNSCWFTTLKTSPKPFLKLVDFEEQYKYFDNKNVININKVKEIPDYEGLMAVPITFLEKYNSDQFEIIGDGIVRWKINNKVVFSRIIIKKRMYKL